jgi:two-component system, NarL family, nitrate/nitrite response regulator NarL
MVSMMVVDDDLMFADALCVALEHIFEIAGVAASLEEAAAIAAREGPDAALVALDHLGGEGLSDAGATILGASPGTVLVAIAVDAAAHPIDDLLREGFCAIISKDVPLDDFGATLMDVVSTRPREGVLVVGGRPKRRTRDGSEIVVDLTRRERQVLELLVEGASGHEIAEELRISINTVRSHIQSLFAKLHVHSQLEAAALAVRIGLVDLTASRSPSVPPPPREVVDARLEGNGAGSVRTMRRKPEKRPA